MITSTATVQVTLETPEGDEIPSASAVAWALWRGAWYLGTTHVANIKAISATIHE